jgi:hypothetical protein
MKKSTKKQIITIFILFAFLGSSLTYAFISAFPTQQQEEFWAARLSIVIFNGLEQIPAGVGVTNETREKLYTLNFDNIIYKDTDEDVKLRDFFKIWGENFNSTCILDYCNNGNYSMRMYVNNVENFDYELYVIKNRDDIIIDYR